MIEAAAPRKLTDQLGQLPAGTAEQHQQRHHRLLRGLAEVPGAGHIQAAGHLPLRLLRGSDARNAELGGSVHRWMGEAQMAHRGDTVGLPTSPDPYMIDCFLHDPRMS